MVSQEAMEQYEREYSTLKQEIEQRAGRTTWELYAERESRVRQTIALQQPDRVPLALGYDYPTYTGISNAAAYYDPLAWKTCVRRTIIDLEPDLCNAGMPASGAAMELLDVRNRLWPGGPLPPDYGFQYVEGEYMKADEYEMFFQDPTGFYIRRYLPRVYGALLPLTQIPNLDSLYNGFEGLTTLFAQPEFSQMAGRLAEAGRLIAEFKKTLGDTYTELAQLGFPPMMAAFGVGGAPFDTLSSSLRGMQGSMLDLYRRPDKVIRACELILERQTAAAHPADPEQRGNPKLVGMPLWRGDKKFMSEAQFERFYWPGLKKALQTTINLGYVPMPFFEAEFGDRLARLLELPKGKLIASIEYVDAAKATEILGGHHALLIRVPPGAARIWSLQDVESFIKEAFDKYGKKGHVIFYVRLPAKTALADYQAMLQSLREYTRY